MTDQPGNTPERPDTEPLEIWLLTGGFVRFEERRLAVEEFVYELRLRCRAAEAAGEPMPWIRVRVPTEEQPDVQTMIELIERGAFYDGLHYIEIG